MPAITQESPNPSPSEGSGSEWNCPKPTATLPVSGSRGTSVWWTGNSTLYSLGAIRRPPRVG